MSLAGWRDSGTNFSCCKASSPPEESSGPGQVEVRSFPFRKHRRVKSVLLKCTRAKGLELGLGLWALGFGASDSNKLLSTSALWLPATYQWGASLNGCRSCSRHGEIPLCAHNVHLSNMKPRHDCGISFPRTDVGIPSVDWVKAFLEDLRLDISSLRNLKVLLTLPDVRLHPLNHASAAGMK